MTSITGTRPNTLQPSPTAAAPSATPAAATETRRPPQASDTYTAPPSYRLLPPSLGLMAAGIQTAYSAIRPILERRGITVGGTMGTIARAARVGGPVAGIAGAAVTAVDNWAAYSSGRIPLSTYLLRVGRETAVNGIGTAAGIFFGGLAGSLVPGPGTAAGAIGGALVGPTIADRIIPAAP